MANRTGILVVTVMLSGPALAQGSASPGSADTGSASTGSASMGKAVPDSNMAAPSANDTGANNGIGQQGSLTRNAGSHSSSVKGSAAAAQLAISPKPAVSSRSDPKIEGDQTQGGSAQH